MEDQEPTSSVSLSSDSDPPEYNTLKTVEDQRIVCTNSHSLDRILKIAVKNVEELAESQNLGDHKAQFVSRFTEVFINSVQDNLTVNGLPWIVNKETLSKVQEKQQQSETNDALLSKLSRTIEVTTRKRKIVPRECCRIYSMKLKQERHNLKKAKISHKVAMPSRSSLPSPPSLDLVTEDCTEVCNCIEVLQEQIQSQLDGLQEIQKNTVIAKDIIQRNEELTKAQSDTGYMSE